MLLILLAYAMGKIRRNLVIGLRIPRTLGNGKSLLPWNRPGASMLVFTGLAGLILTLAGAITDIGGPGCHTAIVMREQSKAALTGAGSVTRALKSHDGQVVTLDATRKTVFLAAVPKRDEIRFFSSGLWQFFEKTQSAYLPFAC